MGLPPGCGPLLCFEFRDINYFCPLIKITREIGQPSREWRVQIDSLPVPRPPLFVFAIARISLSQALSALHLRKWLRGHCGNVVRFLAFPPCGFESTSPCLALGGIKNSE
jgi:hypothetical protein